MYPAILTKLFPATYSKQACIRVYSVGKKTIRFSFTHFSGTVPQAHEAAAKMMLEKLNLKGNFELIGGYHDKFTVWTIKKID